MKKGLSANEYRNFSDRLRCIGGWGTNRYVPKEFGEKSQDDNIHILVFTHACKTNLRRSFRLTVVHGEIGR